MDRLRRECPWDQRQTHLSLVRYLVEETYELIEAIESGDPHHVREELGDLLLQVVFHARIATEDAEQPFDIDDVAAGIIDKLVYRHPHVFADLEVADAADVERNWDALKAREKARTSPVDEIPLGLPALSLAAKVVSRVAAVSTGSTTDSATPTAGSVGDALYDLVVAANTAGIDAEQALRARVAQEMAAVRAASQRALPDVAPHRG